MILYKDEQYFYDLQLDADWRLKCLLAELEHQARKRGCGVRVTSVVRDRGVHRNRALDCGFFELTTLVRRPDVGADIAVQLNGKVDYGLAHDGQPRPSALWHDAGSGFHLHLQVPDHELILRQ